MSERLNNNMIGVEMDYVAQARKIIDDLGWQQTDSECQMQIVRHIMDLVAELAAELQDMQQVRQWTEGRVATGVLCK
jgi:hypothetical protein